MRIVLEKTGKKYIHQWIFRNLSYEFSAGVHYGVLGNNGSGKSTLLKMISGFLHPTEGSVQWMDAKNIILEDVSGNLSIASPHLELIEEFSLQEILTFHQKFRSWIPGHNIDSLIRLSGLAKSRHKPLKYFSSGMKQRVKLLLAVMSTGSALLLDEPCSNLDERSIGWYRELLQEFAGDRLLIIGSNDMETECFSCSEFLQMGEFPGQAATRKVIP